MSEWETRLAEHFAAAYGRPCMVAASETSPGEYSIEVYFPPMAFEYITVEFTVVDAKDPAQEPVE